jgi:hypothetical protein
MQGAAQWTLVLVVRVMAAQKLELRVFVELWHESALQVSVEVRQEPELRVLAGWGREPSRRVLEEGEQ